MVFYQIDKPKTARILFNDPVGNTTRKNSAEHVYDDKLNEKAGKQKGGKPRKKSLDEIRALAEKEDNDKVEEPAPLKQLDGLEAVSTHATR